MKITLDKTTIETCHSNGVTKLHIFFVQKGCAGTKVDVSEHFDPSWLVANEQEYGISIFTKLEETGKLDSGRLTKVDSKWIFTSGQIQSRCGCGSSFSFEKKAIDPAKLKNISRLLGKQKNIVALGAQMKKPVCED